MKASHLAVLLAVLTLAACQSPRNESSGSDVRGRYGSERGSTGVAHATAVATATPM